MIRFRLFVAAICLYSSIGYSGGGSTGKSGGDIVYCPGRDGKDGDYAFLDWAAVLGSDRNSFSVSQFRPYIGKPFEYVSPLIEVAAVLSKFAPNEYADFLDFKSGFYTSQKEGVTKIGNYIWVPKDDRLEEIDDEDIQPDQEIACKQYGAKSKYGTMWKRQLIIRTKYMLGTKFEYNKEYVDFMRDEYQISFFLLHEWLWNFSDKASVSRSVNLFLHQEATKNLNWWQFRAELEKLGLKDSKLGKGLYRELYPSR